MAPPSKTPSKDNRKPANPHKPAKKQFKPKSKGKDTDLNDDVPNKVALHLEDDAPDFPRGGGSSLSRAELEEIHTEVDGEFEGGERFLKKKDRKVSRKGQSTEDDLGSLFGDGIMGKLPKHTNKITFKNIAPGMKLWGVISEVNEKDVVVSLPGGLRGLVRAPEAFDPIGDKKSGKLNLDHISLSSIYHPGQLVSCIVLQVDDDKKEVKKRRIWLSLRLSLLHKSLTLDVIQEGMVLSSYVKSIEDHGYILHFGSHPFTGFMAKNNQTDTRETKVKIGQLMQGVVKSFDKTRKVVYLSSDNEVVSKSVTRDLKGISIDLLVPGMMVNAIVRSTLENGVMLSFLTYFTGTVDMFNLQSSFPSSNWKDDYTPNKKVNARVLFIDPSTRAIGLTLNHHLVHNKAPPTLVKTGDIFEHSKVVRVDRGFGVLLEVPSLPVPTPAFVSVSDVADKEVKKLEKTFKEGTDVRVRIQGFRNLEGLATGTLKMSAFEGSVFSHSDVKPGMVVKAKVIKVDTFGAILQLASGIKALCPLRHMSEFEITKPRTKFQIGADLVFRVLGCKSKRITVTYKKTLVKSKLIILSSYTDATEGLTTHGWITKIEDHGCFVRFYNGVHGFAARSELGLDPGSDIKSMYHVEQVVKCRVTSAIPASKRINLSFRMTPARVNAEDDVVLGSIVSGVVERVTPHAVVVTVNAKGHTMGSISHEHLADQHDLAARMSSVIKPGFKFDKLLVLDVEGYNLILSAKYSLVESALQLPVDASQVQPHSIVPGYVCNLIDAGCFVRFVGRLTGFAPKNKAIDDRRLTLSEVFSVGQSVRCHVLDVHSDSGRITLSLKQSLTSSTDASFIQEYFILEEKIAKLQSLESAANDLTLVDQFNIGSVVKGQVAETKDFGAVINFPKYKDVLGFISHHQFGGTIVESGSTIEAAVLDVSTREHLVDLSLKPHFVTKQKAQKKRKEKTHKELVVNRNVNAMVEIVKEHYLVLSLPEYGNAVGYASLNDYNTQNLPARQFSVGQSVVAKIMALPTSSTCGRLLLLLKSISEVTVSSSSKRAKKMSSYNVGSLVDAEISEIKPLELRMKFGSGFDGRVHITEVTDDNAVEKPFSKFRIGQTTKARIVSMDKMHKSGQGYKWELSVKPSLLIDSSDMDDELKKDFNYSSGQQVTGYIYKVDREWAWLAVSRNVNAKLFILDTGSEPHELEEFTKRFYVGKTVSGFISSVNKEKRLLRLVLRRFVANAVSEGQDSVSDQSFISRFMEGSSVGGRISKILPGVGGMLIEIDNNRFGKVHYTELKDGWVSDPMSGYREGQFVKCRVLEVNLSAKGTVHVDISLRSRSDNFRHQLSHHLNSMMESPGEPVEKVEDLRVDMSVQGYVKSVTSKGCFIMLSRKVDGKILLSNLSDGFIENPENEFPVGKLVSGKVVAVEPLSKRVEVSLKTSSTTAQSQFDSISAGNIISGIVKRVEHFGLFIRIDGTNTDGLCHISELSDEDATTNEMKHKAGERVTAKVLKVDKDRHRISLGMKASYFKNDAEERGSGQGIADHYLPEGTRPIGMMQDCSLLSNIVNGSDEEKCPSLAVIESRASIPTLEVSLDSIDDMDSNEIENLENAGDPVHVDEQINKRAKKKAKEEREQEISAAEKRLLEEDSPKDADEFEKLVRSSPNSSFVWIKYMDFMLKLADVEKAREVAERALRTINMREESEKLNVWIAYLNLENVHGKPPEEAVLKIFQRASQYCDPKKLHFALLRVYEEDKQDKLADELLVKMVKKFKQSCKVWLRRVQWLISQNNSDGVQAVINRALLSLPRHKHIKFISQTAILEFKNGVPERGRSMFEGILKEYPKRTDLWSVYLDQEIRLGDADVIRTLFERATSLQLHPKKMKFLFKKYHKFEQSLGDEEKAAYVKNKAIEYVETLG